MTSRALPRIAATASAFFFILYLCSGIAVAEIKLGILPRLGAVELFVMFNPLAEYLAKETGEKVSIVIPKDFEAFKKAIRTGQVNIGFANPLIYVQLKKEANLEPLALSAEPKAGTQFRGIIIVRKDSKIETAQDLKGKKLVFVDKDSAAGFLFQMLLLKKAGLNIKKDFVILPFAKKHDNVAMAVFNGAADAGGIREDDLEKMKNKVNVSQIKIVGYTDYFPNWPVFTAPGMNKETAAKIKAALLKLSPSDPRSGKILRAAKLEGFALVSDKDYDKVRRAATLIGSL